MIKKAIAGLVLLTLGGAHALAENSFKEIKNTKNSEPEIISTFEYESHRKGYEKDVFRYNLWSDGTISQADKLKVEFAQRWFYDIDGDGKFGEAEAKAIKSGKLIYMHPEFNKIANQQLEKILKNIKLKEKIEIGERKYPSWLAEKKIYEFNEIEKRTTIQTKQQSEVLKRKEQKKLQKDGRLSLILRGTADTNFNNFGGGIGLQYTPIKNLGVSILANFSKSKDENISYTQTPAFKDIYGEIRKDEINSFSIGPSFELQIGPLFIGGGFNYWNWIEKTEEKIIKSTEVKKSNINSVPNSKIFGNMYTGLEFKFKNFGLGASMGYDTKEGPYVGARTTIRLNRPKREFKK